MYLSYMDPILTLSTTTILTTNLIKSACIKRIYNIFKEETLEALNHWKLNVNQGY